jgi:C4-dicarboxylate-specific signal transduction histidine kinase
VVRDVVTLLSTGASPDAAPITWTLGDGATGHEVASIGADALKQVLLNLAQNGRDAIGMWRAGAVRDGRAGVHIVVHATGSSVVIEVRDDGPGIPTELATRVFDPFFTTKPDTRGVGLGLSIAEGLVRGAGGRLTLTSGRGGVTHRGAVFAVELPRSAEEPTARTKDGTASVDTASATHRVDQTSGVT